jgi:hypothetical protein
MKAAFLVFLLTLAFVALSTAPAVQAAPGDPLPIEKVGWAGDGKLADPPGVSPAYAANLTLTTPAAAGDLIVVVAFAGWSAAYRAITVGDNAGDSYARVANQSAIQPAAFWGPSSYFMKMELWTATAKATVSLVQVPANPQGGNIQNFLWAYATAYANASRVGTTALAHISAVSTTPTTSVHAASWVALIATEVQNTITGACPTTGSSSAKAAATSNVKSYLTANTSAGLPAMQSYYDSCEGNILGLRGMDSGGPIPTAQSYKSTLNQYVVNNNLAYIQVEIVAALEPQPDIGPQVFAAFWVMVFISILAVIVVGTYILRRNYL